MLDKLDSFCSYIITIIQILVGVHYMFCKWLDTLDFIIKLLKKIRFFCNNIKNISNKKHYNRGFIYELTNYI